MTVLITGATGFVGQNLRPYLEHNFAEKIIPLNLRSDRENQIDDTVTAIVHLAGKAHDLKKTSNPAEYYEVNYELTKGLYDKFLSSNASTFIFISSVKAAADTVQGSLTEEHIPVPETDYGKSKLMAEEYIRSVVTPPGKAYYILRPCMIHGPGNKGNLNLLYKLVMKNIPYPLAAFSNKRSFLSVQNLCFVIMELLIQKEVPSGTYLIADDEALATRTVVEVLAKSIGNRPKLWYISPNFIRSMAKLGDWLHLPLTTERLNKLTENYIVSNQKILSAIQKPLPLSSVEGLTITAKSFHLNKSN